MRTTLTILFVFALGGAAVQGQTVTLSLDSTQDGQTVAPGTTIDWTITVEASVGDNVGLALVVTDLVQDAANPAKLDIPPGDVGTIDATMTQFSRPDGISNPGEDGATTGYIGVQRGTAGEMNLVQVGGGQNIFGMPGTTMGLDADVEAGIGQSGSQVVLSGSFAAPVADGNYTFRLDNAVANVLDAVNLPPHFSPASRATIDTTNGSFSFTVGQGTLGDLNCDGLVNGFDIDPFVLVLGLSEPYDEYYALYPDCDHTLADINDDGLVNGFDIDPFIDLVGGG